VFRGPLVRQVVRQPPAGSARGPFQSAMPAWRQATHAAGAGDCSHTRSPCTPASRKTSSTSRDQVIFADRAVGASLSSDAIPLKIDRFGPRAAWGTLESPPVRDKNGLSRLRTVTMKIPEKPNGRGARLRSPDRQAPHGGACYRDLWLGAGKERVANFYLLCPILVSCRARSRTTSSAGSPGSRSPPAAAFIFPSQTRFRGVSVILTERQPSKATVRYRPNITPGCNADTPEPELDSCAQLLDSRQLRLA
jgi:hypothetical protein